MMTRGRALYALLLGLAAVLAAPSAPAQEPASPQRQPLLLGPARDPPWLIPAGFYYWSKEKSGRAAEVGILFNGKDPKKMTYQEILKAETEGGVVTLFYRPNGSSPWTQIHEGRVATFDREGWEKYAGGDAASRRRSARVTLGPFQREPVAEVFRFAEEFVFVTTEGKRFTIPSAAWPKGYVPGPPAGDALGSFLCARYTDPAGNRYLYLSSGIGTGESAPFTLVYSYQSGKYSFAHEHSVALQLSRTEDRLIGIYATYRGGEKPGLDPPRMLSADLAELDRPGPQSPREGTVQVIPAEKGPHGGALLYFENGNRLEITADAAYFVSGKESRLVGRGRYVRTSGAQQYLDGTLPREQILWGGLQTRGTILQIDNNAYLVDQGGRQVLLPFETFQEIESLRARKEAEARGEPDLPPPRINITLAKPEGAERGAETPAGKPTHQNVLNASFVEELRLGGRRFLLASYGGGILVPDKEGKTNFFDVPLNVGQTVLVEPSTGKIVRLSERYLGSADTSVYEPRIQVRGTSVHYFTKTRAAADNLLGFSEESGQHTIELAGALEAMGLVRAPEGLAPASGGPEVWLEPAARNPDYFSLISNSGVAVFARQGKLLKMLRFPGESVLSTSFQGRSFVVELEHETRVYEQGSFRLLFANPKAGHPAASEREAAELTLQRLPPVNLTPTDANDGVYRAVAARDGWVEVSYRHSGELIRKLGRAGQPPRSIRFEGSSLVVEYPDERFIYDGRDLSLVRSVATAPPDPAKSVVFPFRPVVRDGPLSVSDSRYRVTGSPEDGSVEVRLEHSGELVRKFPSRASPLLYVDFVGASLVLSYADEHRVYHSSDLSFFQAYRATRLNTRECFRSRLQDSRISGTE
jgi:hypothetical protein